MDPGTPGATDKKIITKMTACGRQCHENQRENRETGGDMLNSADRFSAPDQTVGKNTAYYTQTLQLLSLSIPL